VKFDRFDFTIWGLLTFFGLALAAIILGSSFIGPRVAHTFPANGGEVNASGRIGLEFAEPMQARTVEPQFEIEPPTLGKLQWEGQRLWFAPDRPFQPGLSYTARLKAGALSEQGRSRKLDVIWSFRARTPWIVYLSPVNPPRQLWRIRSTGGDAQRLTNAGVNVQDFAVSPNGQLIVYSQINPQRGSDLRLMTGEGQAPYLLVNCGVNLCARPAWSPDGTRIAYNRHGIGLTPGSLGPPRVWIVEAATGQAAPLYEDSQIIGSNPSWSPDGQRMATLGWLVSEIRVLNLQTRQEVVLPNILSRMGTWSPDGQRMLLSDLILEGNQALPTLNVTDFTTLVTTPILTQTTTSAYVMPAWSPSGDWVAAGRRPPDGSPGRQLWLMRPDGQESRAITNDPQYVFDDHQWDPWGQGLLFLRFEPNKPYFRPEIVVWSMATGKTKVLARDTMMPAWQP
jgi:Tol biopolymer transport system component